MRVSPPPAPLWLRAVLGATLVVHGVWVALETVAATDLYWAMATGRYIVAHGRVPDADVFSFTYAGAPWANQEWLTQVLFWELYRLGGGTALAVLRIVATVGLLALAVRLGRGRGAGLAAAVATACAAAYVCRPNLDIRPHLFLFLWTLVVLGVVDAYRRGAGTRVLAWLPVVFLLWVDTHFSFVFGLGVVGLLAAVETARAFLGGPDVPSRARALRLDAAVAASFAACLVNPQGVRALVFPFSLLGADALWRKEIIEWAPPVLFRTGEAYTSAFLGWLLVAHTVLALLVLVTQPRRFDWGNALVVATTAAMALGARRFGPLFALVAAPFGAANLSLLARRRVPPARWHAVAAGAAGAAAVAALVWTSAPYVRANYRSGLFAGMSRQWMFPHHAADFLTRNPLPARLAHLYQWGGYLMFAMPDRRVFIDGRGHTVYPASLYVEYLDLEYARPGWPAVLDRWQASLVLWPSTGLAFGQYALLPAQLDRSPAWVRIYDDGDAVVFAHRERGRAWADAFADFRLEYPEAYRAQLFLADAYFAAHQFDRARRHLQAVNERFGHVATGPTPLERQVLARAEARRDPLAWFHVGMYREVRHDGPGAAEAYRTALAAGLGEPHAAYAREAVTRLALP